MEDMDGGRRMTDDGQRKKFKKSGEGKQKTKKQRTVILMDDINTLRLLILLKSALVRGAIHDHDEYLLEPKTFYILERRR